MNKALGIVGKVAIGILLGWSASARAEVAPAAPGQLYGSLPLVMTRSGPVQGIFSADGTARMWLGLPYAMPPVGERRWRAPQPHAPWSEVLKADSFGSACAQTGTAFGPPPSGTARGLSNIGAFGKPEGSEDCLSLNIWRPNSEDRALPVIVFVHGGGNMVGYSGDPGYDGARLAVAANALVVTINYRLGIFGWFLHPALKGEDPLTNSGNFGDLDIIQSLRFVQANAAAFGADPGNITLMGQSAGAIDVFNLMASKLADGLFQKAIVLSGLIASTTMEKGYSFAADFAAQMAVDDGLAETPAEAAKLLTEKGVPWVKQYLLSTTAGHMLNVLQRHASLHLVPTTFGDGIVIPHDLPTAFDQGKFQPVPLIAGTVHDEAKLFTSNVFKVSDVQLASMMQQTDPDAAPVFKTDDVIKWFLLPSISPALYNAYARVLFSLAFPHPDASITRISKYEPKVFAYRFDWNRGPEPWNTVYGAVHALDLPFVFGNFSHNFFSMDFSRRNQPGREALSRLMMQVIGAFIRTGDPNVPGLGVTWEPWGRAADSQQKLIFDASDLGINLSTK